MVEQVVADAGRVDTGVDAMLAEMVAIPNTGEHQQLRTVDRAAAQHHFATRPRHLSATILFELDADGTSALEEHLGRRGLGEKSQVGALERRPQVGIRGAPPGAPALGDMRLAKAFGHSLIGLFDPVAAFLERPSAMRRWTCGGCADAAMDNGPASMRRKYGSTWA